jgi:hypothetical protein
MGRYRFKVGQRVRIRAGKNASIDCQLNAGKVATIKARCKFTWAYELEELDGLWLDSCFDVI